MSLMINAISLHPPAGFAVRQTLEPLDARTILRTLNGTGVLQSRWRKLASTISGSGWLPDGLDALDTTQAVTVACIEPLSVASPHPVITLPRAVRIDSGYAPQGAALVDGQIIATPTALAGLVATLTAVPGAVQYHVVYYPVLTGFVTVSRQFDDGSQTHDWTMTLEER